MNLDPTLTVQSNQTDQFTIIMSVINCTSFSMKHNGKTHYSNVQFQSLLVQVFTGIGFYQWPNYPIVLFFE